MYFSFTICTMGELKMTEYAEVVAKRKLYLASEEWGNKIAQHYVCSGDVGDIGFGMGYFIFFIWKYVTQQILPALDKATRTTIALIDRIRMLDNDMIRMDHKINTILELRDIEKEKKDE